ncbi:alpha/beta hydrolase [Nodosilinea sp. LEGE 07088]|uniref:alpha/beta hydrolase n=1 Tax=Nodosilinea sp. LEGE 07088 TaxID=2777968 RepID=UPI00187F37F9|nr:alpha/beta hydrolase [Nodosilinea sp. LEGE 07088]MBE9137288.1 alpha/beta hydrolase [Nodosilinea sp. LEGE 07088]
MSKRVNHLKSLFRTLVAALVLAPGATAADQVTLTYGPFERHIPTTSLEIYAQEHQVDEHLAPYLRSLTPERQQNLHQLLTTRLDIGVVSLSQMLYSPMGEVLLRRLGELVQTEGRQNGLYGLRSALVIAAASPEGLTLLNVMRQFPTSTLRINLAGVFALVQTAVHLIHQTEVAIAAIQQQAVIEIAAAAPLPASDLDLTQPGPVPWHQATWSLNDPSRQRQIVADLYLPQTPHATVPVVVISHGFVSDRHSFEDLAQHLASHGFAVATLDHPGSNRQYLDDLLQGYTTDTIDPQEFVHRPQDISFLLDVWQERQHLIPGVATVNLNQVGIIGLSLGGYTGLVAAGAQLNQAQLTATCINTYPNINLSVALQCQALRSTMPTASLQDPRIKAVFAINPITSSLLGADGLGSVQVPVMMVAGSNDIIAPALPEQIQPFMALPTAHNYLVLLQGGNHTYSRPHELFGQLSGPDPDLARQYFKALGLAFFKTHVAENSSYKRFLQARYAHTLSREPLPLSLVQFLPSPLAQALTE